ncbi:unnamed protein product [Kluyveromyces dobzhanskii CBS 2104]|uniref:Chromatin modification-related protein EAF7 n=1 Tax=Kluyveromyces dobzhanskii CBS 2104 TaxID=1427455 RepID=A0A0A8KZK8_9SACH|nr:unnamed protein product [Kluyveromyces dobzhanskii CBS 2104]
MSAVKIESPRGQTWSKVDEIRLFKWMMLFKPAGVHKHFHMFCLLERLNKPDQYPIKLLQSDKGNTDKVFSGEDVWEQLSRYYNLEKADEVENLPYSDVVYEDEEQESAIDKSKDVEENDEDDDNDEDEGVRITPLQNRLLTETEFELSWEDYGELILEHAKDQEVEKVAEEGGSSRIEKETTPDDGAEDPQPIETAELKKEPGGEPERESKGEPEGGPERELEGEPEGEPEGVDRIEKCRNEPETKQETPVIPPTSSEEPANELTDVEKKPRTRRSTRLTRSQKRGLEGESEIEDEDQGENLEGNEEAEDGTESKLHSEKESSADSVEATTGRQVTFAEDPEVHTHENDGAITEKVDENDVESSQLPRSKKQRLGAPEDSEEPADADSPARRTRRKSVTKPTRLSSRLRSRK